MPALDAARISVWPDWEGDLIVGKNNLSAIGTLVERRTGYTMLVHLPDGYNAEQVRDALTEKIKTIPEILAASSAGIDLLGQVVQGQGRVGGRRLVPRGAC